MRRAFLVALTLVFAAVSLHASVGIDTAYVVKDRCTWKIKTTASVSQINVLGSGQGEFTPFTLDMRSELRKVMSVAVSWHGIALSASFDPFSTAGKKPDFELGFKSYGRKFGAEVLYQNCKSFSGTGSLGNQPPYVIDPGLANQQVFTLNTYYVLNHKKFSYPAAMTQNTIQKRSAGSFLTGATVRWRRATVNGSEGVKEERLFSRVWQIGVGFGYGYNLVLPFDCLIHVSAVPYLVFSPGNYLRISGENVKYPFVFPEPVLTARGAIVKNFDKIFIGANSVLNYSASGRSKGILLEDTLWSVNVFVGIRLGKYSPRVLSTGTDRQQ